MTPTDPQGDQARLLTTKQAAAIKHVTAVAIQRAIQRNALPAIKLGRDWMIQPADLAKWHPRPWKPTLGRRRKKSARSKRP